MKISSSSSTSPTSPISPALCLGRESPESGSTILSSALRTTGSLAKARHMESTGPASVIP
ncbi:unnamed protein product [Spirodela intermedia]|uniref:Uncharacterized protein n=2 Tax=Spirodela intermedia TaxID=51605 RepID=A0A7I8JPW7_SPIIN|nr:unnamed protein product [Spirodela intermedia]CAA6672204.1 unnamed protein product [Spirodela intermedia]CAA7409364.1 unnamed protein product [Spirodela intermedia]